MDRRKFLINTSIFTAGIITSPYIITQKTIYPAFKGNVIIIGAGAAGIYAAHYLNEFGIDFQLLEASDQIGGRLRKKENFADYPIDLGAQWLHGKRSIVGKLIKATNTTIVKDQSDYFYWYNNKLINELPKNIFSLFNRKSSEDINYLDFARHNGYDSDYHFIIQAIASSQGADAKELSAFWNLKEEENWSSGNADYKFSQTYFDLIYNNLGKCLEKKILKNTVVKQIDYTSDKIIVTDSNHHQHECDKVIVTVPISILKNNDISFTPALPDSKIKAFYKIGMGPGMKVFLKFSEKFYHENIAGGKYCAAYADDLIGKNGNDHVLLGFIMGDQAAYLTSLQSDELIINTLIKELDGMYQGKASKYFQQGLVQDWTSEPYIKGAYSFSKVGIGDARSVAALPIDNRVYFAGEAMNLNGHHQTVHGAAETGMETAKLLVQG